MRVKVDRPESSSPKAHFKVVYEFSLNLDGDDSSWFGYRIRENPFEGETDEELVAYLAKIIDPGTDTPFYGIMDLLLELNIFENMEPVLLDVSLRPPDEPDHM